MRLLYLLLCLLLMPAIVLAQTPAPKPEVKHPPVETIPPGEDKIEPVKKGHPAPYDGQLFSVDTSIRWANWLQQYKYRLAWDVELEKKVCEEEKTYRDSLLRIEKERSDKTEKSLRDALRKSEQERLEAEDAARNPPWYSTMEFGMVVGAVATAAVFALAVWAVDAGTGD